MKKTQREKQLEEENATLKKREQQRCNTEYCKRHGHDWYRNPYVGPGGTNYLTCKRCNAETTD